MMVAFRVKPHWAALFGGLAAVLVAVVAFGMPPVLASVSFLYGVAYGLLKIAWIVIAAVFLYDISVYTGQFEILKVSVTSVTPDRRIQLLLVAFCFGAFLEGSAGFGTPVAIDAEPDCEYGACGVWGDWRADSRTGCGFGAA
jgi:lactate permease